MGHLKTWQIVAIAGGGLLLFYLYMKNKSNSGTTAAQGLPSTSTDSQLSALEQQLISANTQLQQLPSFNSSGFAMGTVGNQPGNFEAVSNAAANKQFAAAGVQQYSQVAPGQFLPVAPNQSGYVDLGTPNQQTFVVVP